MSTPEPGSDKWHRDQIKSYKREVKAKTYEDYAKTLEKILKRACKIHAPTAIVQARAKSVSSFAEKALRRCRSGEPDGKDPVNLFLDLCGARVITNTQAQVDAIVGFIRDNFVIDRDKSQDTAVRLRPTEFGYRSVHLIVQAPRGKILGVSIPPKIGCRKAEIQVRTVVQHAWAEVSHNLIYKSEFQVPPELERDCNRTAALLENADKDFGQLVHDLEHYRLDHGSYLTAAQMKAEIATLKMILINEPEKKSKPGIALRIGRVACAAQDWTQVIDSLQPFKNTDDFARREILVRLGIALCRLHAATPGSPKFKHGQKCLHEVARPDDKIGERADPLRGQALARLGWSHSLLDQGLSAAEDLYYKSYLCDPDNPCNLLAYVDASLLFNGSKDFLRAIGPSLSDAAEKCRRHAEVRVELPWVYLALGRFLLLLERPNESLAAYAKAVHCAHSTAELEEALWITRKLIGRINKELPQLQLVDRLLTLGLITKPYESKREAWNESIKARNKLKILREQKRPDHQDMRDAEEKAAAANEKYQKADRTVKEALAGWRRTPEADWASQGATKLHAPVVIVAGSTRKDFEPTAKEYLGLLREALRGFSGTIISGGTTSGICGVVAEVKRTLEMEGDGRFKLLGYLPNGTLPNDAKADPAYENIQVGENGFSAWQPLQNWIDIIAADIDPADVRVLSINGGEIAALECRLALAMGATVGLLADNSREGGQLLPDEDWKDAERLFRLPKDVMTVRAFVNSGHANSQLKGAKLEAAGRAVHENYRQTNVSVLAESDMQIWESLREDFKNSNCQQAACAERILRAGGFGLRKASGKLEIFAGFTEAEIERMAEMEHGRWNADRLQAGWRYSNTKDKEKKLSPYLVPWNDVPPCIKKFDYAAVRHFPEILAAAGLEVYRLAKVKPAAPKHTAQATRRQRKH
jgi:ppGpp synthetase/RelA/SpoT-type nucleotidyltranferase